MAEIIKNGIKKTGSKPKVDVGARVKVLRVEPLKFNIPDQVAPPVFMPGTYVPSPESTQVPPGYGGIPYMDASAAVAMQPGAILPPVINSMPQGNGSAPSPVQEQGAPAPVTRSAAPPTPGLQAMQPDVSSINYPALPGSPQVPNPVAQQQEIEKQRQQALRIAAFLPLIGGVLGGGHGLDYANRQLPNVAANLSAGSESLTRERQGASNQQMQIQNGVADEQYGRGVARSKAQAEAQADHNKAINLWNGYVLDLQKVQSDTAKGLRESEQERASIGQKYTDMLSGLTPESQNEILSKMDPDFKQQYGIVDAVAEKSNPNEPTRQMLLQKQIEQQYQLLRANPALLSSEGGDAIAARIEELERAAGIAPGKSLPPDIWQALTAEQREGLKIRWAQAETGQINAQTGQMNAGTNAVNAQTNATRAGEAARHNQVTEGIQTKKFAMDHGPEFNTLAARIRAQRTIDGLTKQRDGVAAVADDLRAALQTGVHPKTGKPINKDGEALSAVQKQALQQAITKAETNWHYFDAQIKQTKASPAYARPNQTAGSQPTVAPGGVAPVVPTLPHNAVPTVNHEYEEWLKQGANLGVSVAR